jgi:hypothetical protein
MSQVRHADHRGRKYHDRKRTEGKTHLAAMRCLKRTLATIVFFRKPVGALHHSDQGCPYTSIAFGSRCCEANIRPSMETVGDAYDNAMCESFNATPECELLAQHPFKTHRESAAAQKPHDVQSHFSAKAGQLKSAFKESRIFPMTCALVGSLRE